MGIYDTYNGIQLKLADPSMRVYEIGDRVEYLADGVYVAPEGVVVILDGKLAATFDRMYDKYGARVDLRKVIDR